MNDEFNYRLIEAVKKRPCIYNTLVPEYSKKESNDKAWSEISEEVQAPVLACKDKWKNIRTVYARKMKVVGARRPYYLNDHLEFLKPFITTKQNSAEDDYELLDDSSAMMRIKLEDGNVEDPLMEEEAVSINDFIDESAEEPVAKKSKSSFTVPSSTSATKGGNFFRRAFLLSLLPEITRLSEREMREFRRRVLQLIDDIIDNSASP